MSNHTDEEIRAAAERATDDYAMGYGKELVDKIMAELNRPAIHPSVAVFYDHLQGGLDLLDWSHNLGIHATNIRVLIPVETAREIVRRAIEGHANIQAADQALKEVDRDIAHFQTHGPEGTP